MKSRVATPTPAAAGIGQLAAMYSITIPFLRGRDTAATLWNSVNSVFTFRVKLLRKGERAGLSASQTLPVTGSKVFTTFTSVTALALADLWGTREITSPRA